jgi:hypothetical protein
VGGSRKQADPKHRYRSVLCRGWGLFTRELFLIRTHAHDRGICRTLILRLKEGTWVGVLAYAGEGAPRRHGSHPWHYVLDLLGAEVVTGALNVDPKPSALYQLINSIPQVPALPSQEGNGSSVYVNRLVRDETEIP